MDPEQAPSKKIPMIPIVVGIILVIGLAGFLLRQNVQAPGTVPPQIDAPQTDTTTQAPLDASEKSLKTINVNAKNFSFTPTEIRVREGDTVRIIFSNMEGLHDFVLDEFNVKTAQLSEQTSEEIEFIADKKGTFEYYCSVGKHRQMGMVGNLIVE